MSLQLWLVVGLGNPGPQYSGNRHNLGFMVAEALAERAQLSWRSVARFQAELARGVMGGQEALLLKPQTYMNLSGESVGAIARYYDLPAERVVAIHDDVDLAPGRLKVKRGGGDGGHKGIRSMAQHLDTGDFYRIRCGVGRPEVGEVTDFVLRDFARNDWPLVQEQIERAAAAVSTLIESGLRTAMNRFNVAGPAGDPSSKERID